MKKPEDEEKYLCPASNSSTSSSSDRTSEDSLGRTVPVAPDGGWGWVVVASAFLCFVIADGMLFTFGVLYVELIEYFDAGKGETALVGSVFMGMSMFAGPFASALINVWGLRPVALLGTFIASGSFACSVVAPTLKMLTLTYGFLGGLGICMIYVPTIIVVGFYFDKRRALANGITSSGSGLGAFVFSPLCNFLIQTYSWKGAMLILSGVVLNCLVLCALYRPLENDTYVKEIKSTEKSEKEGLNLEDNCSSLDINSEQEIDKLSPNLFEENNVLQGAEMSKSVPHIDVVPSDDGHHYNLLKSLQIRKLTESHSSQYDIFRKYGRILPTGSMTHDDIHLLCKSPEKPHKLYQSSGQIVTRQNLQSPLTTSSCIHLKPLEKKDIFYSGSLQRIPAYNPCDLDQDDDSNGTEENINQDKSGKLYQLKKSIIKVAGLHLLTNPIFILITAYSILWTTHSTILTILPHYSVERGYSHTRAATLLSIIGIANTIGRLFAGWLSNFEKICCVYVNMVALFSGGVICLTVPFTQNYVIMCIQAAVFGSSMATWTSLRPIVLVELLGINNLTNAFGLLAMFQGFAFIVGPPIAGTLYDWTGSYKLPFLLAGAAFITSGVISLITKKVFVYLTNKNKDRS